MFLFRAYLSLSPTTIHECKCYFISGLANLYLSRCTFTLATFQTSKTISRRYIFKCKSPASTQMASRLLQDPPPMPHILQIRVQATNTSARHRPLRLPCETLRNERTNWTIRSSQPLLGQKPNAQDGKSLS